MVSDQWYAEKNKYNFSTSSGTGTGQYKHIIINNLFIYFYLKKIAYLVSLSLVRNITVTGRKEAGSCNLPVVAKYCLLYHNQVFYF